MCAVYPMVFLCIVFEIFEVLPRHRVLMRFTSFLMFVGAVLSAGKMTVEEEEV